MGFRHAPEPWRHEDDGFCGLIADAEGKWLIGGEPYLGRIEPNDPNAIRLIGCVNACEGWSIKDVKEALLVLKENREQGDLYAEALRYNWPGK